MRPGVVLVLTLVLTLVFLGSCASQPQTALPDLPLAEPISLVTAASGTSGRANLNVSIRIFDSDVAVASSVYQAAAQVRSVERRYLPFVLKSTLDRTRFWGAVRVMPRPDPSAEVLVEGRILESSGVELQLDVRVVDATGHVWIDQVYHDGADDIDYASDPNYVADPFQDIYNRIANDMHAVLAVIEDDEYEELLNIAMVRYGQTLSPDAFDRYVRREGERFVLSGLPAKDDPLLTGIQRVRDSEYLFADSVDAHYEGLYRTIGPTYAWWRYYGYELMMGNEKLEQIDATRGATRGSWYAMERIYKTFKEAKMNQDALRELTESFDRETAPISAEISGRLVELSGTLDAQYETWRRILGEMYRSELGLD